MRQQCKLLYHQIVFLLLLYFTNRSYFDVRCPTPCSAARNVTKHLIMTTRTTTLLVQVLLLCCMRAFCLCIRQVVVGVGFKQRGFWLRVLCIFLNWDALLYGYSISVYDTE